MSVDKEPTFNDFLRFMADHGDERWLKAAISEHWCERCNDTRCDEQWGCGISPASDRWVAEFEAAREAGLGSTASVEFAAAIDLVGYWVDEGMLDWDETGRLGLVVGAWS